MSSDLDVLIGKTVGNHRVVSRLGEGGMGVVFLAEHPHLGRKAAIKVLHHEYSRRTDVVNRFFNEARAAARLRHPGIIEIYDFGTLADESAYIVMELLDGEPLAARVGRKKIVSVQDALAMVHQLCRALAAAHRQGIVHRDLKPDNVFIVSDPEIQGRERVKILDFGIAKLLDDTGFQGKRTHTSAILGTPVYMSPEQCEGAGYVDHRSDIYSLGVILYEMLTGQPPFTADGIGKILAMHMATPPVPPRDRNPDLPPEVDALVLRMLAKPKEERFQSCDEAAAAIEGLVGSVVLYADDPDASGASTFRAPTPTGQGRGSSPGAIRPTPYPAATGTSPGRTPAPPAPAHKVTPVERPPSALAGPTADHSGALTAVLHEGSELAAAAAPPGARTTGTGAGASAGGSGDAAGADLKRTTLSTGVAAVPAGAEPARGRRGVFVGLAAAALVVLTAGGVGVYFVGMGEGGDTDEDDSPRDRDDDVSSRDDEDSPRSAKEDDPDPPATAAAKTAAPASAAGTSRPGSATAAPGLARVIRIEVASTPAKAKVLRLPASTLVGETPCVVLVETDVPEIELVVRRAGYYDERVKGTDGAKLDVKLRKVKGAADEPLAIPRDDVLVVPR